MILDKQVKIPDLTIGKQRTETKAEKSDTLIVPIFKASKTVYDDKIGYEQFPFVMNENTVTVLDGNIRRIWFENPEGSSPFDIVRFYENWIKEKGGEIFFKTREPKSVSIQGKKLSDYFKKHRMDRGLSTYVFSHTDFPGAGMTEYICGKFINGKSEVYVIIASGKGAWAASQQHITYSEIVTVTK